MVSIKTIMVLFGGKDDELNALHAAFKLIEFYLTGTGTPPFSRPFELYGSTYTGKGVPVSSLITQKSFILDTCHVHSSDFFYN